MTGAVASPDPDAFRPGLLAWFSDLSGIAAAAVVWEQESTQPMIPSPGQIAMLDVVSDVSLGGVETQRAYDAGTDTFETAIGGPRKLTIQIKVDGYDQRSGHPIWTLTAADTKIGGAPSLDALRALGFALIDTGAVLNVGRPEGGRTFPRAVLEVVLGYTAAESLTAVEPIAHARVTSHLRDEAGTELPSPPNTTTTIPPIEP